MSEILTGIPKFQIQQPFEHMNFFIVCTKAKTEFIQTVGYIQLIPNHGWIWYSGYLISYPYNNKQDAIDDLLTTFMTKQMDLRSEKMGVANDEDYTKGK